MSENLNIAFIAIAVSFIVISIFVRLRYSLLIYSIIHIAFTVVMLC